VRALVQRVTEARVTVDGEIVGAMNLSLLDTGGAALVVSQFTLDGDTARGRRPSFVAAARPETAEPLIDAFGRDLAALGVPVATGRFRADMRVALVNDGPVTVLVEVP
jgi:D-tyrosyl-tRNA(Tyr) deacylase